jgi:hypothetical protein
VIPSFARQTWTRERYPFLPDDGHGNEDRPDFDAEPSKLAISGCSIQPGASLEVLGDREAVRIAWTIYQPPGSDVLATDFGRVDGVLYRVSGEPQRWTSPTGALSHDVVLLEVWEG